MKTIVFVFERTNRACECIQLTNENGNREKPRKYQYHIIEGDSPL